VQPFCISETQCHAIQNNQQHLLSVVIQGLVSGGMVYLAIVSALSTSLPSKLAAVQPSPCFLKQCCLHSFAAVFIESDSEHYRWYSVCVSSCYCSVDYCWPLCSVDCCWPFCSVDYCCFVVSTTAAAVTLESVMIGVSTLPAAGPAGPTASCASCYAAPRHIGV
jgi:hypothetical protein